MKKTPPFFHRLLILSLSLIGACILLFSYITYRRIAHDLNYLSRQMMLNQVKAVENNYVSLINEMAGRLNSLMTIIEREKIDRESSREVLDNMASSLPECRHIWILRRTGETLTDSGTNGEFLSRTDWWKDPRERVVMVGDAALRGQYVTVPSPSDPFRDDMGLNTILPVVFYQLSGPNTAGAAFAELDLTTILISTMLNHELIVGEIGYPLEVSLYDREGILLESSVNYYLSSVNPPGRTVDLAVPFDDRRYSSGAVFIQGKERVTVYSRNTELGMIFSGSLPTYAITSHARRAAVYILIIGMFCLLSVLALGLLLLRTYHRMKHYEKEQASARFQSLQNHMNPHFLFNTLDSLVGVAESRDFSMLMSMLRHLSYILHMNLRITRDIIPMTDEIRYIESYVALQKIRYKDQFTFDMAAPEGIGQLEILRFCLQPVVENCFVHGVAMRTGAVAIKMDLWRKDKFLYCDVTNSPPNIGPGDVEELRGKLAAGRREDQKGHLGLISIHRRLRILYGEEFGIELIWKEEGFTVRVTLPVLG